RRNPPLQGDVTEHRWLLLIISSHASFDAIPLPNWVFPQPVEAPSFRQTPKPSQPGEKFGPAFSDQQPAFSRSRLAKRSLPAAHCLLPTAYRLLPSAYCANPLYYHQHNGKETITRLFSSTSWQTHKLTFFLHVFSTT
ncbi:MAG: hypothetical protein ABSF14_18145, partial [Terriglobia bacterium]